MSGPVKVTEKNPQAASVAMGVPLDIIKICINRGADGCNANGSINTVKLKKYIEENKVSLEQEASDSIGYWKKENAKEDNAIKKLQRKTLQRNTIQPEEVAQLLVSIGTVQSAIINGLRLSLTDKVLGKSRAETQVIIDAELTAFLKVIKDKETKYGG
jgi:hypothetical protein